MLDRGRIGHAYSGWSVVVMVGGAGFRSSPLFRGSHANDDFGSMQGW